MTIPNRALRGGPWDFFLRHCRSAHRFPGEPGEPIDNIGFRVVCVPPGASTARCDLSMRGGSWFNYPWDCRSAYRIRSVPGNAVSGFGFRVVCLPQEARPTTDFPPAQVAIRGGFHARFKYPRWASTWCRSACRGVCHSPDYAYEDISFRVVCLPRELTP